jgi:ribosomal protein L15E
MIMKGVIIFRVTVWRGPNPRGDYAKGEKNEDSGVAGFLRNREYFHPRVQN